MRVTADLDTSPDDATALLLCRDEGVWHAAIGEDAEAIWRPIRCGDGIALPGPEHTPEQVADRGGSICVACVPQRPRRHDEERSDR